MFQKLCLAFPLTTWSEGPGSYDARCSSVYLPISHVAYWAGSKSVRKEKVEVNVNVKMRTSRESQKLEISVYSMSLIVAGLSRRARAQG